MLNLEQYQSILDTESTELRCKQVLDEIAIPIKSIFHQFLESIGISDEEESYSVHTYDATLRTTYHDARNPTYAEKKKNSDIGKKYFVQLQKKVGESDINLITMELNGLDRRLELYTGSSFYPVWAALRSSMLDELISKLDESITIYYSDGFRKGELSHHELSSYIRECVKPQKRPSFYFGTSIPLEGEWDNGALIELAKRTWGMLEPVQIYLEEEKIDSERAGSILNLLADFNGDLQTKLLNREYQLKFGNVEQYKPEVRRQSFYLTENEQLLTKGYLNFYNYHKKNSPFQTLAVSMEGHNHIFTNMRELLGVEIKEWWVKKLFATQSLDNEKVMQKALYLLNNHEIPTKDNSYYLGTFRNDLNKFEEEIQVIKKRLVNSAVLFAHASEKLLLPEESLEEENGFEVEVEENSDIVASFTFPTIYEMIESSKFTFHIDLIRDFHLNLTALDDKHFVILNGISGTGKTQLCRLYANAVYGLDYESENPYLSVISVRPDWMDATALFGYYSSFEKNYVRTEFLNIILRAQQEREKPHFIVLDEMNLARVEYYLSDYLSAVESKEEIFLHDRDDVIDVPRRITIPPNVYILGTINVDETTHTISDKVLDRAFVMTLSDVDFDAFWLSIDESIKEVIPDEFNYLLKIYSYLLPFDLHFGYRTMNEIIQKLYSNLKLGEEFQMEPLDALDRVISEKILPKLRGDERIEGLLDNMISSFSHHFGDQSESLKHISRMKKELERYGTTQYWR